VAKNKNGEAGVVDLLESVYHLAAGVVRGAKQ
jgi:hypothetical protein